VQQAQSRAARKSIQQHKGCLLWLHYVSPFFLTVTLFSMFTLATCRPALLDQRLGGLLLTLCIHNICTSLV
jgi:hypothetical protein